MYPIGDAKSRRELSVGGRTKGNGTLIYAERAGFESRNKEQGFRFKGAQKSRFGHTNLRCRKGEDKVAAENCT
jgi:hypothetical protein